MDITRRARDDDGPGERSEMMPEDLASMEAELRGTDLWQEEHCVQRITYSCQRIFILPGYVEWVGKCGVKMASYAKEKISPRVTWHLLVVVAYLYGIDDSIEWKRKHPVKKVESSRIVLSLVHVRIDRWPRTEFRANSGPSTLSKEGSG